MRDRCGIWLVVLFLAGCSAQHPPGEPVPITSERIAELKQLCYSAGPFSLDVPATWRPVAAPSRRILAFSATPPGTHHGDDLLYAHAVSKARGEPLDRFIDADVDQLSVNHPTLLAAEGEPILIPGGKKQATIKYLEGDSFGGRSIVAYIDEGTFVGIIGFSSHHPDVVDTTYPFFEKVVRSYRRA